MEFNSFRDKEITLKKIQKISERLLLEELLTSSIVKKKAHRLEGASVTGNSIKSFLLNRVIVQQLHFLINNLYKSII